MGSNPDSDITFVEVYEELIQQFLFHVKSLSFGRDIKLMPLVDPITVPASSTKQLLSRNIVVVLQDHKPW